MKPLKAYITVALLIGAFAIAVGQQVEKTLVKSFNLQGLQSVQLDLKGEVDVQEWDNDILRIQMTIGLENGNETQLKALIKAHRYYLKSKIESDEFIVFAPALHKEVRISGVKLNEAIRYTINAPRNVLVKQSDAATSIQPKDSNTPSSL